MVSQKKMKKQSVLAGIATVVLGCIVIGSILLLQRDFNAHSNGDDSRPFLRGVLYFNEVMSSNQYAYADPEGDFYDWIEIYNAYADEIDLTDYSISKSLNGDKWNFPAGTKLESEGCLILWFIGEEKEGLYVPFRISKKGGDEFFLWDENNFLVDKISVPALDRDRSASRSENGVWSSENEITPGFPNTDPGRKSYENTLIDLSATVQITEVCTRNKIGIYAEDGNRYDWIELHNFGSASLSLEGFYLSDESDDPLKWQFPSCEIAAGEYMVIFASGLDGERNGEIHTSFRLPDTDGSLTLRNKRGIYVSSFSYDQPDEYAVASLWEGHSVSTLYSTPGFENSMSGYISYLKSEENGQNGLIISEIMVLNDSLIPTDGNRYYDWVELYNATSKPICLEDYYLSDDPNKPDKSPLPSTVLNAGEYCIVYLSGEISASTPTVPHASFRIDNQGELLLLTDGKEFLDSVWVSHIPYGYSFGRVKGEYGFFYSSVPTPSAPNAPGVREISVSPSSDVSQGVYDNVDALTVSLTGKGDIRYTLDGSEPNEKSILYNGPVTITNTTVIRAISLEEGKLPSPVTTLSYILNEGHVFPVVSLVTDPGNLWDEEYGIYVKGNNAEEQYPYPGANYYEPWERAADVSLFEDGTVAFSLGCGVKIFGQTSRVKEKKSFQLKFKTKYGSSCLRYEVFDTRPGITRYDSLVLRSGSQDYDRSTFRDELLTGLVDGEMELLTQAYRPCILYLNGEYWGIYYIREKIDEDFISQRLNVSPESVTILRGNWQKVVGNNDGYISFYSYAKSLDMTIDKNYQYVCSKIDINSLIDYIIAQAYTGNRDLTNVKFYKTDELDGKWRWIFFDQDYGFDYAYVEHDYSLANIIKEEGTGYENKINNELIRALLKNPEFLDLFLKRYGNVLATTFSEKRVKEAILSFKELVAPEQERNANRWNFSLSVYRWYISTLTDFVNDGKISRTEYLINEAGELFSLDNKQVLFYFYPEEFRQQYPEEWESLFPAEIEEEVL